jgi:hypothetical protein
MGKTTGKLEANATRAVVEQGGGNHDPPLEPRAEQRIDATERLTIELARLRAKFGADPAIAGTSLDDAWMSPTAAMEEDEAEFIDAVADCLGVGLSLDAALNCWDSGGLFYDGDADDADEAQPDSDVSLPAVAAHHVHATGRRLVIQ